MNTGLTPLEPEECNTKPTSKMSKSLQQAYAIAAEGHDLDFYKQVLAEFQEESARLEAEALKKQEEAEAKAAAKADKDAKAKDSEAKDKKKKSRRCPMPWPGIQRGRWRCNASRACVVQRHFACSLHP